MAQYLSSYLAYIKAVVPPSPKTKLPIFQVATLPLLSCQLPLLHLLWEGLATQIIRPVPVVCIVLGIHTGRQIEFEWSGPLGTEKHPSNRVRCTMFVLVAQFWLNWPCADISLVSPNDVGLYAGIKFFLIDFVFKRCPRLRAKYDTPYIIWLNLPTDPQLKDRANATVSRRVSSVTWILTSCIAKKVSLVARAHSGRATWESFGSQIHIPVEYYDSLR